MSMSICRLRAAKRVDALAESSPVGAGVPTGTAVHNLSALRDPEVGVSDRAGLNSDIATRQVRLQHVSSPDISRRSIRQCA